MSSAQASRYFENEKSGWCKHLDLSNRDYSLLTQVNKLLDGISW